MKKLVLILSFAFFASCKLPTFENAKEYEADIEKVNADYSQDHNSTKPLGYTKALLPYPQNENRPNPVYELEGLEGRQIELRAQVVQKGSTLCVRDNDEGPDQCSQDSINQCYTPSKDKLRFEFYCVEGCMYSDVWFYFRIIKSNADANDMWCTNRDTDGYPADLLPGFIPGKRPTTPTTPKLRKEGDNASYSIIASLVVTMLALTFTMCLY